MQGQSLWQTLLPAPLLSTPVAVPLGVVVVDKHGNLSCFSAEGSRLWARQLNQTLFYSAPLMARQALFIATAAGDLWKIDPASGATIWTRSLSAPVYATPVASPWGLLVGDNQGTLQLIDFESGRSLASHQVEGPIQSQVLVTGNRLYFGSRSRNLHALELLTGGGRAGE
jgi:outer membrane protein assembly factor BamB